MVHAAAVAASLVAALAALPASAAEGAVEAGAALYRGEGLRATLPHLGGLRVEGTAAACARCHGAEAGGQPEGGLVAPPLAWRRLRAPTPARPGYDAALLRRALAEGQDPAGRALHPVMPRYALTEAEVAALVAFLDAGPGRAAAGVTDEEIRLAVPHLPGEEFVPALLGALWAEPGRVACGRRLRAVPVPILAPGEGEAVAAALRAAGAMLAAVAGPGARVPGLDAALAARGLPHLFPLDGYDAAPAAATVVLAEAPVAVQLSILRRQAEAVAGGGVVALLCGGGGMPAVERGCTDRVPPGARAVVAARPLRSEDLAALPAGATLFAALDHAAPLLRRGAAAELPVPLVLADPRGRAMPGPVLEEIRRLAPGPLARWPELVRRVQAAAVLTALALQRTGPWPGPAGLRAALAGIAPGQATTALLAPLHDGVREDGAYGVQLLHLAPGSGDARADTAWERP